MPSALLWARSEEKYFLFAVPKRLRALRNCFFTGRTMTESGVVLFEIDYATCISCCFWRRCRRTTSRQARCTSAVSAQLMG